MVGLVAPGRSSVGRYAKRFAGQRACAGTPTAEGCCDGGLVDVALSSWDLMVSLYYVDLGEACVAC